MNYFGLFLTVRTMTFKLIMFSWCNGQQRKKKDLFEQLPNCQLHDHPSQFICSQSSCRQQPLLCVECISTHRDHKWQKLNTFFTKQVKDMFITGNSTTSLRIEEASSVITELFSNFKEEVADQIGKLEEKISTKLQIIRSCSRIELNGGNQITQQTMSQFLYALQKERTISWVQNFKIHLQSVIGEAIKTFDTIIEDVEKTMGTDWQQKTHLQNEIALKVLKQHLHNHKQKDLNYFKFSAQLKHPGVILSEDRLDATFKKNLPSRPVVIIQNPIQQDHYRFAFQIKKLQKTAFIFAATTIFIGVCNPTIVKSVGMRRISQVGKGAYMIGSSGWSYHHKNAKFDRKDVVGFGFSEGEKVFITIEVEKGEIVFEKQGKIFKSKFSMPLDLPKKQILQLKPCVSFDGDEGAIVSIVNL